MVFAKVKFWLKNRTEQNKTNKWTKRMNWSWKPGKEFFARRTAKLQDSLLVIPLIQTSYNCTNRSITFGKKKQKQTQKNPSLFPRSLGVRLHWACWICTNENGMASITSGCVWVSGLNNHNPFLRGLNMVFYSCLWRRLNEWPKRFDHSDPSTSFLWGD